MAAVLDLIDHLIVILAPVGDEAWIKKIVKLAKEEAKTQPVVEFVESQSGDGYQLGAPSPFLKEGSIVYMMIWEEPEPGDAGNGRVLAFVRCETKLGDDGPLVVMFKQEVLPNPKHVIRVLETDVLKGELELLLTPPPEKPKKTKSAEAAAAGVDDDDEEEEEEEEEEPHAGNGRA